MRNKLDLHIIEKWCAYGSSLLEWIGKFMNEILETHSRVGGSDDDDDGLKSSA